MYLLADSNAYTVVFIVALALTIVILLKRSRRFFSRSRQDSSLITRTPRPGRRDAGHHLDAPPDVLRWEVQMHETARELSAQLDSKMGALQALIADADRAAARLEAAAAETSPATPPSKPPPSAQPPTGDDSARSPDRCSDEEIYTLSDYGLDAAEIAARIGSPVGEVELILDLRDKS